jgi:chromosome segregation ATPase
MTTLSAVPSDQLLRLRNEVHAIDQRLGQLRTRLQGLREKHEEQTAIYDIVCREFACGDASDPAPLASKLRSLEAEMRGLTLEIQELEADRERRYSQLDPLEKEHAAAEHKQRIDALHQTYARDCEHVTKCAEALHEAEQKSNRSFFAWKTVIDHERIEQEQRAINEAKIEWQKYAGPNASNWRPARNGDSQ